MAIIYLINQSTIQRGLDYGAAPFISASISAKGLADNDLCINMDQLR